MPKKNRKIKSIDFDPEIDAELKRLAKEYGIPVSQLYNFFAAEGAFNVKSEADEKTSFWSALKPSKSRGYKHNLDLDALKKKLRGE